MNYYDKHYTGYFWIKENSNNGVPATLYIDNSGNASIETYKRLEKENDNDNSILQREWLKNELVFGIILNKDKSYSIKLFDTCTSAQTFGNIGRFQYSATDVLISDVVDDQIEELQYSCLMMGGKELDNWIPDTGFKHGKVDDKGFCVAHNYKQPASITLFQDDDFKIYVFFRANTGYKAKRESYIKESVYINIELFST